MGQTLAMLVLLAGQPAPDVSRADPGAPQVATLQPPPLQSEVDDLRRRLADLERRLQPAEPPTAAPPPVPAADDGRDVFRFRWRNGLIGETPDGQYQVHLGGRLQSDYAWYSVPDRVQNSLSTPLQDGVTLRRVRLETDGVLWKTFEFALHVDFARTSDLRELSDDPDANVYITDAYIGLRDVPWLGTVRVGHQKEALTFEGATSSRFLPFMERSLAAAIVV
jgi:phosphate-selective porin